MLLWGTVLTVTAAFTSVPRVITPPRLCLAAILAVAAMLRGWDLGERGFITPYYLAGVRSMLASWHNFVFNAFDPAGFVSLDKPPVAFWIQTLSAKLFGFSPFSVLLPQLIEGLGAIVLLYVLVRRRFGELAGLVAALALAFTPVAVAVDRSNNTESCLVLVLLFAAWAAIRALETARPRYLLLWAVAVGIGFNTKMLVAFGIVPVVALIYLFWTPLRWRVRFAQLGLAGTVLAAVAASWVLLYELTPPSDRPFVDSSPGNSMLQLVVGHNALERFVHPNAARREAMRAARSATDAQTPLPLGRDFAPAGPLRLFAPRLAAQMAWLFPLALIGGVLAWRRSRPAGAERLDLLLWAGWAASYGIVFSAAGGLFHAYYLVVMAPALAALAGIGAAALWANYREGLMRWLLPGAVIATAIWQAYIIDGYGSAHLAIDVSLTAVILLIASSVPAIGVVMSPKRSVAPLAIAAAALLLGLPAAWSIGTAAASGITGFPAARPPFLNEAAANQRQRWAMVAGALAGDSRLLAFLSERDAGEEFLLAAVNARLAAPVIIATGRPVMALGGFNGRDPILSVDDFARLVAERRVRFALIGDGAPGLRRVFGEGHQQDIVDWIRTNGRPVDPALWRGTDTSMAGWTRRGAEAAGVQLYDLRPDQGG
ncbi:MAG: glycosyltransferase family 39 protein [Alphaproteobacteria bacterium]|nr:glycosyltransferase family 39 protein [Alphaproteobacteria bacterium]